MSNLLCLVAITIYFRFQTFFIIRNHRGTCPRLDSDFPFENQSDNLTRKTEFNRSVVHLWSGGQTTTTMKCPSNQIVGRPLSRLLWSPLSRIVSDEVKAGSPGATIPRLILWLRYRPYSTSFAHSIGTSLAVDYICLLSSFQIPVPVGMEILNHRDTNNNLLDFWKT